MFRISNTAGATGFGPLGSKSRSRALNHIANSNLLVLAIFRIAVMANDVFPIPPRPKSVTIG